jgi:hypothetical protein
LVLDIFFINNEIINKISYINMRKLLALLSVAGFAISSITAYRFASVNDIHADLNYNPSVKGSCITKIPEIDVHSSHNSGISVRNT